MVVCGAVGQNQIKRFPLELRFALVMRGKPLIERKILTLAYGEINFYRIDCGNRCHRHAIRRYERSYLELGLPGDAINRSDQSRKAEIEFCGFHGSLGGFDLS